MKKKLFILFCLACLLGNAQPGKEAWHWYFGQKSMLDFSSGAPIAGVGIPAGYWSGGCASISDANTGQYLFTVGGTHIYNKNNTVMNGGYGVFGSPYNSQDLIVPKPGSKDLYYVFTPDKATLTNRGITYSVVDMSLQGGLGSVTLKNKLLTPPPTAEKITAVRHCNGTDYWVLTHSGNSDGFNAYLITSSGLDTIPVISHVGTVHQFKHWNGNSYFEGIGCMKASPNGKKLASAIQSDSIPVMDILDFDNSTGIVSNPVTITYTGIYGPYGVSFSPDNSRLYAIPYKDAYIASGGTAFVYQYDMSSGMPSIIIASQTLIFTGINSYQLGAPQVAPDGKMYTSRYGKDTMAIINNPNALGTACNFQFNGIVLSPGTYTQWSPPNFIDAIYAGIQINIPDIQLCDAFTSQTVDAGPGFTNYYWSTGAGTQTISVNSPGKYWVTVTNEQGCTKTDTVNAYLLKPLQQDTFYCGSTYIANVTQGGVLAYNWYDGNTNPIRNFSQSGNYYVDINFVTGCAVRDSIFLKVFPMASVNIGPDTTFCLSNFNLNAQNPKGKYLWSTGETSQQINATKAGTYWVVVTDSNGCKAIDTMIVHPQLSAFNFQMPNIVTPNGDKINDEIDFGIYQFSSLQIEIYNRWGQKVFESSDSKGIWKPSVDDGTYFYTAQYKIDCGSDSQTRNLKGFITVIR